MTDRETALYRYLTLWADFRPDEALRYCDEARSLPTIHRAATWSANPSERIEYPMEQDKNRRAA